MKQFLVVVATAVILVSATIGWAQDTITVAPGESLQAAINRAPAGAVIDLTPGNWAGNIVIDKSITIRSVSKLPDEPCNILVFQVTGVATLAADQRHRAVSRIVQVFQDRITLSGLTAMEITPAGIDRVVVTFPRTTNPQTVIDLLKRVGQLGFCKVVDSGTDIGKLEAERTSSQQVLPNQQKDKYFLLGAPLITGADVAEARMLTIPTVTQSHKQQPMVAISLTESGAKKFAAAITALKVNDRLAIVVDSVVYTAPKIDQSLKDIVAEGGWQAVQNAITIQGVSAEEATDIAIVLESSTLPYPVRVSDEQSSSTTRAVIHQAGAGPAVQIDTAARAVHVVMDGIHVTGAISVSGQAAVELADCAVSDSGSGGITLSQSAYAMISGCTISGNGTGISVVNTAHAVIKNCDFMDNGTGVLIADSVGVTLIGNRIERNARGVVVLDRTCANTNRVFRGFIIGHSNVIPGPNDPEGNKIALCRSTDLAFLTTTEGGMLDRRQ